MTWGHYLYAIAGVLLTFWLLMTDGDDPPIINAALMSLLFGPFIGVPLFIVVLVCFGNWPVIVRNVWACIAFPFRFAARVRSLRNEETRRTEDTLP